MRLAFLSLWVGLFITDPTDNMPPLWSEGISLSGRDTDHMVILFQKTKV